MALPPDREYYIGVDFDGTCILPGDYPGIRKDMPDAVTVLRAFVRAGMKILLITSREKEDLDAAVAWFNGHGIPLAGINENSDPFWEGHRKIYCDSFIDDRNIGVPTAYDSSEAAHVLDWKTISQLVFKRYQEFLVTGK